MVGFGIFRTFPEAEPCAGGPAAVSVLRPTGFARTPQTSTSPFLRRVPFIILSRGSLVRRSRRCLRGNCVRVNVSA